MRFADSMRATSVAASLSLVALCVSLAGCTLSNSVPATPTAQSLFLTGSVYGGSLPISGAHVYLYAANTQSLAGPGIPAGPGILNTASNASVSLLQAASNTASDTNGNYYVTTGSNGSFSLTGDFATCTPGQQLYLYSSGGVAVSGGSNNSAIGLLADIGQCTASYPNSSTRIHMSEMSTVGMAYAVAGFASDATHIGDDEGLNTNSTAAFAQTGMSNAFANAANLVTLSSGSALNTTPGGNGTIPTSTLNTIASLLAACVQSSGSTSIPCIDLFTFTGTPVGGDTATASILLAQNPAGVLGSNVSITTLFNSLPQNSAFIPILGSAPNDFSIAVVFAGTGINAPTSVAIDVTGSPWITNSGNNSVSKFSSTNDVYTETDFTDTSLAYPVGVAIDTNGNIWIANNSNAYVTEFSGAGTTYTANSYTATNINLPEAIAVDGNNNVWITDLVPSGLTEFSGSGSNYTGTPYTGVNFPYGIGIDANNSVWAGSLFGGTVTEFTPPSYNATPYTDNTLSGGYAVGIDASGTAWVAGYSSNSVTAFAGSGTNYTSTTYSGGGLNAPDGLAVDGGGNIWLANSGGASISEFSNAGLALSPVNGYTGTSSLPGPSQSPLKGPTGVAVDASGNVWVSDSSNAAVEYVGAATPTVVPFASAIQTNKLGARP